jgi:hypothetical protein
MKQYYQHEIEVFEESRSFKSLDVGDAFAMTVSTLWVGFNTYLKTGRTEGVCINNGDSTSFELSDEVLLVRYKSIKRGEA